MKLADLGAAQGRWWRAAVAQHPGDDLVEPSGWRVGEVFFLGIHGASYGAFRRAFRCVLHSLGSIRASSGGASVLRAGVRRRNTQDSSGSEPRDGIGSLESV